MRYTGFEQQHVLGERRHPAQRRGGVRDVVENTVRIDNLVRLQVRGERMLDVQRTCRYPGVPRAHMREVFRARVGHSHRATAVKEEARVVSHTRTKLENASARDRKSKGCEVFLAPPVVSPVMFVLELVDGHRVHG
jgi:hypothetical protein